MGSVIPLSQLAWTYRTNFLLRVVAIVVLLMWGSYGILLTQTSPNDQGSIINAAFNGENQWTSNFLGNGTAIRPGSTGQFIIQFETNIPANIATGTFLLPNDGGIVMSPVEWSYQTPTDASNKIQYAIFTFSFCSNSVGCFYSIGPYGNAWLSGPQGNISDYLNANTYAGVVTPGQFDTVIFKTPIAGNYTLHILNPNQSGSTYYAKVAMGPSFVVFTSSHPYLYQGLATVLVAAGLSAVTGLDFRRNLKTQPRT